MSTGENYKILKLSDAEEWKEEFKRLPESQQDVYYLPEYYSVFEKREFGTALCFLFKLNGERAMYPFIINNVNALGFRLDDEYYDIQGAYGYNGVVSSSYDPRFVEEFRVNFDKFCHSRKIIAEFVRFNPIIENQRFFSSFMEIIPEMDNVILDLSDEDYLYSSYEHSTRKNIKKAVRENLQVLIKEGNQITDQDKNQFFDIYISTMKRNNADDYYFFSKGFFDTLFTELIDNVVLGFTEINGKPISTEIVTFGQKYAYSYLGGTLSDFFPLRPNEILKHELNLYLRSAGHVKYCLGGGTPGVIRYKKAFSKNGLVPFCIGKKIHNQQTYDIVCQQWEKNRNDKVSKYQHFLLKYHY